MNLSMTSPFGQKYIFCHSSLPPWGPLACAGKNENEMKGRKTGREGEKREKEGEKEKSSKFGDFKA